MSVEKYDREQILEALQIDTREWEAAGKETIQNVKSKIKDLYEIKVCVIEDSQSILLYSGSKVIGIISPASFNNKTQSSLMQEDPETSIGFSYKKTLKNIKSGE